MDSFSAHEEGAHKIDARAMRPVSRKIVKAVRLARELIHAIDDARVLLFGAMIGLDEDELKREETIEIVAQAIYLDRNRHLTQRAAGAWTRLSLSEQETWRERAEELLQIIAHLGDDHAQEEEGRPSD
jgi:hypothetical protein